VGLLQVVELASHVRPTGDFLNPTILFFIELIESGIGIGLQRTLKPTQMSLGMFALAIGRVGKPHRRCRQLARRPIVSNIGPQTSRLRLAIAWRQHRYRRVIGTQLARCQHGGSMP